MKRTELLNTKTKTLLAVFAIYFLCFAFRFFEYFIIRTDQTFFGEAFIHKLIGIGIMVGALFLFGYKFKDIGFKTGKAFLDILKGLAFGLGIFVIAYGVEILILVGSGARRKRRVPVLRAICLRLFGKWQLRKENGLRLLPYLHHWQRHQRPYGRRGL